MRCEGLSWLVAVDRGGTPGPARSRRGRALAASLLLTLALPGCTAGMRARLTNPSARLALTHPPGFGLLAERVAFGPSRGGCGDEIVSNLTAVFLRNEVEVVDPAVLDAVAAEAAAGGGPTLVIDIQATQCDYEQDRRTRVIERTRTVDDREVTYVVTEFISETTGHLRTSVRVTDLATGRVRGTRTLAHSPNAERRSEDGYPEFPSGTALLDEAIQLASMEVERLFLPWTEIESLVFFDEERCGMDAAWLTLDAGDRQGALEMSLVNLERCRHDPMVDDATLARAHHNVGAAHALLHDYVAALPHFRSAARLEPGNGVFSDAVGMALEAEELAESMRRLRDSSSGAERHRR